MRYAQAGQPRARESTHELPLHNLPLHNLPQTTEAARYHRDRAETVGAVCCVFCWQLIAPRTSMVVSRDGEAAVHLVCEPAVDDETETSYECIVAIHE